MSPARRLLFASRQMCFLHLTTGARTKKLGSGCERFSVLRAKNLFSVSPLLREYTPKRLSAMHLICPQVFVVELAVW